MEPGPGQAEPLQQRTKRVHNDAMNSSDDDIASSASDGEGFELFLSRYSKRLRRQQNISPSTKPIQASQPVSAGPSSTSPQHAQRRQQQQPQPQRSRSSRQKQHHKSGKSRSQLYDEVIETVATQSDRPKVRADITELCEQIKALQLQVTDLTQKVEFLLSVVGMPSSNQSTSDVPNNDSNPTYSSVVAKSIKGPIRDAVLAAVHADLQLKQSRHCNIVVSGLPHKTDLNDEQFFSELCWVEFHVVPVIMHTKRLGRKVENKLQPLLIVLQDEDQAKLLLSFAKLLRDSQDDYTASSIFISPHQTRAERQAAYEARCQRRNQASTRMSRRQGSTDLPSATSAGVSDRGRRATDTRRETAAAGVAAAARLSVHPTASVDAHPSALTHDVVTLPSSAVVKAVVTAPAVQPSTVKELDHGTLEQIVQLVAARLTHSPSPLPPASESKLRVDVATFQPSSHTVASVPSVAAVTASGSSGSG